MHEWTGSPPTCSSQLMMCWSTTLASDLPALSSSAWLAMTSVMVFCHWFFFSSLRRQMADAEAELAVADDEASGLSLADQLARMTRLRNEVSSLPEHMPGCIPQAPLSIQHHRSGSAASGQSTRSGSCARPAARTRWCRPRHRVAP
jgi:hypothetical protein